MKRQALFLALLILFAPRLAEAQESFHLHYPTDGAITIGSWSAFLALNLAVPKTSPPTRCLREACVAKDDGARPYNRTWHVLSYVPATLAFAGALAPSYVRWSDEGSSQQAGDSTLLLAEALGLNFAATEIAKIAIARPRPFLAFPAENPAPNRLSGDATASFWSGHTSATFAAAALGSFDACLGGGPLGCVGPAVGMHVLAASTGLMRILAGKHHVSDVIVGAAVGSAIGTAVALAHARKGKDTKEAGPVVLGGQAAMLSMFWLW